MLYTPKTLAVVFTVLPLIGCTSLKGKFGVAESTAAMQAATDSPIEKGLNYETAGNDRLALQEYQQALEQNPNDPAIHHRLGVVCDRLGRFDDAERHYQAALTASPDSADLHNDLGYSYYLNNRLPEAEAT